MSDETRREFLLRLARGTVYAAPVVRTLAAPERLAGQANPSQKGMGKMKGLMMAPSSDLSPGFGPSAPWDLSS